MNIHSVITIVSFSFSETSLILMYPTNYSHSFRDATFMAFAMVFAMMSLAHFDIDYGHLPIDFDLNSIIFGNYSIVLRVMVSYSGFKVYFSILTPIEIFSRICQ